MRKPKPTQKGQMWKVSLSGKRRCGSFHPSMESTWGQAPQQMPVGAAAWEADGGRLLHITLRDLSDDWETYWHLVRGSEEGYKLLPGLWDLNEKECPVVSATPKHRVPPPAPET